MKLKHKVVALGLSGLLSFSLSAAAELVVGVSVSATGPAAALGAPQRNAASIMPTTIGGEQVKVIILDDASDPNVASRNARNLVDSQADVILGGSTVSNAFAITEIAVESKTPLIGMSPAKVADPTKAQWVFPVAQDNTLMADALIEHMVANDIKRIGVIGFADPYGDDWLKAVQVKADVVGIQLVTVEKYNRSDTSVNSQVVKLIAARPDAVLILASGTPAALPHIALSERGFKGQVYQTHGAAGAEFLKAGGKAVENGIFVIGPLLINDLLPEDAATKEAASAFIESYTAKFGADSVSTFSGHVYDAWALLEQAVPKAKAAGEPGSEAFRVALRDALENTTEVKGVHGVYNMSPSDHFGHDERARYLVQVKNGTFQLVE